jgi:catalase
VATNLRGGQMAFHVDLAPGVNPSVNYEPSTALGGLKEAPKTGPDYEPEYKATKLVRRKIDRTNDYKQAGERYNLFEDWERDDLIKNLVNTLAPTHKAIQDKMVEHFTKCDPDYGRRVAEGLNALNDQNAAMQKGPIGTTGSADAVHQAEEISQESKPY